MNEHLTRLKQNLESAQAVMRRVGNGQTPDQHWCGQQLMLIRLIEEAGVVTGEWDGLFVGLLDDIVRSKKYLDQLLQNVATLSPETDYHRYVKGLSDWSEQKDRHATRCAEFLDRFADRLALKEKA